MSESTKSKESKWNAISIFSNSTKASKFWFTIALISFLVNILQPVMIINALRGEDYVVLMDGAGVFHRAPLTPRNEARDIFEELTIQACDALFLKNPNGYDRPKLQQQMFLDGSLKTIKKIQEIEAPHFAEYNIHQKWELKNMNISHPTAKTTNILVTGQLIRNGSVNKSDYFNEALNFKVLLVFARNPDMSKNERLPYAVAKLKYKVFDKNEE